MNDKIKHVSDADFQANVLDANLPVLVDFWAEWCGPCKMIAPILDDIADAYEGKINICKMNVDTHRETPMKYNVRGIPTLILFKHGDVESMKVGAVSRKQLTEFIDAALSV